MEIRSKLLLPWFFDPKTGRHIKAETAPRGFKKGRGPVYSAARWRCNVCGLIANGTGLAAHQRATGHFGREPVEAGLQTLKGKLFLMELHSRSVTGPYDSRKLAAKASATMALMDRTLSFALVQVISANGADWHEAA